MAIHNLDDHAPTAAKQLGVEAMLARQRRLYAMLSHINQAIVHEHREEELFQAVCDGCVVHGGFQMAWIASLEPSSNQVVSVAAAGEAAAYLSGLKISLADPRTRNGPTGQALLTGKPVIFDHLATNPDFAAWRSAALRLGYAASAAFPFRFQGRVVGTLNVYSAEFDFFDTEEVALLEEATADISFALRNYERDRVNAANAATLRESEARFRMLFDHAPFAFQSLDEQGRLIDVNPAWLTTLGYSRDEVIGRSFGDFVHQDEVKLFQSRFPVFKLDGVLCDIAFRLRHSSGRIIDVVYDGRISYKSDGSFQQTFCVFRDVTEAKRTAARAEAQNQLFQTVLGVLPDVLLVVNADGKIAHVQSPAREGPLALEGWKNRRIQEVAPAAAVPQFEAALRESEQFTTFDFRVDSPTEEHWIEVRIQRLPDGQASACVLRDITEQHRTTTKLGRLSQAIEQNPESVVITNLNAEIEYVNAAFLHASGYESHELIGQNPRLLKSGKTPVENYDAMWQNLTNGETWRGQFINRRKDGSEYVELVHVAPLRDDHGQVTHFLAVKQDISETLQLAEELGLHRDRLEHLVEQRTAELREAMAHAEAASQAKSTFLTNMSHEIRTPLNAILGLAQLMQREPMLPVQGERLHKLYGAASHLLTLLNDLLDLSKIEAGRMRLEETELDLPGLVNSVCSLFKNQADRKGLHMRIDLGDVPRWVRGDPTRLRQVLLNHVSNAVKFTDAGSIVLRVRKVRATPETVVLRFEVQDSGCGIAEDRIAALFEPFEQADTSTTRRFGGTGLGLTIARHLVELMGGESGARSRVGEGSTFWFTVPLNRSRSRTQDAPVPPLVTAADLAGQLRDNVRVLLVEDDAINREVAAGLLVAAGLTVDAVTNGALAVERISAGNYDLVLMDIQMPVLDGLAATRAIRLLPGRDDLPILALTANVFDAERRRCLSAGMDAVVSKPIIASDLYAAMRKWLPARCGRSAPVVPADTTMPEGKDDAQLRDKLRTISGLDCAQGLNAMGGDARQLARILIRFDAAHHADPMRIRRDAEAARWPQALACLHRLRGAASTLGLIAIAQAAGETEAWMRTLNGPAAAGRPSPAAASVDCDVKFGHLDELDAAFSSFLHQLRTVFGQVDELGAGEWNDGGSMGPAAPHGQDEAANQPVLSDVSASQDHGQATVMLAELGALLAVDDAVALPFFLANEELLATVYGPTVGRLAEQIERVDFPAALAIVEALKRLAPRPRQGG